MSDLYFDFDPEFDDLDETAREISATLADFNVESGRGELTGPMPEDCPACLRPIESGHHGCHCDDY